MNKLVVPFMKGFETFMVRHGIKQKSGSIILNILWQEMVYDDTPLGEEDPKKRVALFFSKIDGDINKIMDRTACQRIDAVRRHFEHLRRVHEILEQPVFQPDLLVWVVGLGMIMIMFSNSLRGDLEEHLCASAVVATVGT